MSTRNEMSATLPRTSMSTIDENLKRFFDCIASICGMIVFSPLFLIIMILIKCDSKGPVIFSQERIGKGGKPFTLYKFRTMNNSSEADGKPKLCQENDERLTKVGKFLRDHHLDELRPGLFSEATLTNGYTGTLEKMLTRLEMDLDYLENRSLWRDTQIIFKTVTSILGGKIF